MKGRYGNFFNPPLKNGCRYRATVILINEFEGEVLSSERSTSQFVVLREQQQSSWSFGTIFVISISSASVVFLGVVITALVFVCR